MLRRVLRELMEMSEFPVAPRPPGPAPRGSGPTPIRRRDREAAAAQEEGARARPRGREAAPATRPPSRTPPIRAALSSRSGLRQAILMQEILGPPKALGDSNSQPPGSEP